MGTAFGGLASSSGEHETRATESLNLAQKTLMLAMRAVGQNDFREALHMFAAASYGHGKATAHMWSVDGTPNEALAAAQRKYVQDEGRVFQAISRKFGRGK